MPCSGDCTNLQTTTVTSHIKTCWNGFTDDVAGLAGFWAQIVGIDVKRTYEPFWVDASEQGNPVILVQELAVRFNGSADWIDTLCPKP